MGSPATAPPRASRWEILGAWLHVWTPPRGVEIPDPPSARRLAAWAGAAAVLIGAVLAITVPRIDSAKDARAARADAVAAARDAARRADTIRFQRASFSTSEPDDAAAQLRDSRVAILADAQARHAAGELPQRARWVDCVRAAGSARADLLRMSCVATTRRVDDQAARRERSLGYPFALVLQPSTGRFAWCRTIPVPAENALGRHGVRIPQPAACRGNATPVP